MRYRLSTRCEGTMKPSVGSSSFSSASPVVPGRSPEEQLVFRTRWRGEVVVLSVRGQADAFTLPLWRRQVRQAAEAAAGAGLIIDATRLEFLSLRTLAAVADDAHRYRADGLEVCLVATDLRTARLAAADPRTAHLQVRSTVVSAMTAIQLNRRTLSAAGRHRTNRTPRIAPDEPKAVPNGRAHYRAGQTVAYRVGRPDIATPSVPGMHPAGEDRRQPGDCP
ncbi:STAS domain-containing protein [Nocardia sp. NPDC024068]|uniref:STAS domain-containing protein n=1 Tax=Nocardia sp. NPDC024068 TaxID=3157197 RepID=UPI0033C5A8ED